MAIVTEVEYSQDAIKAANTALLALIDGGSGPGLIRVYDEEDTLLVSVPLDDPAGTVNATTGKLTLDIPSTANPAASGFATGAEIADSDLNTIVAIPVSEGSGALPGYLVMQSLTVVEGEPVEILLGEIG